MLQLSLSSCTAQVAALVTLVRDLKLAIFSLKRQDEGLQSLVQQVAELLTKHSEAAVMDACSRTLQHCAAHGPDAFKVRTIFELFTHAHCRAPQCAVLEHAALSGAWL